ncbi:hypothetical protein SAMN05216326_10775 [Nitrosomonas marina]|uniref:Uncharacterized protein n=1 Tax=Nitrosomonas marina TaxID=917 RepID=A0A1I0AIZ8_9PROT|nr:hypothetical protein [Nitrosomonas marina]SES94262.1 hypothetical protein SAMN05216326_10775 [Nitrosomonas marina]
MADKLLTENFSGARLQGAVAPGIKQSVLRYNKEAVRTLLQRAPVPVEFKQSAQSDLPGLLLSYALTDTCAAGNDPCPHTLETTEWESPGLSAASGNRDTTQPFYLTDTMVNLTLLEHAAAGLQWFDARPLSALVTNTCFLEACFPSPVYWCVPSGNCSQKFLNKRRGKVNCNTQVVINIPNTKSIPIYWVLLGSNWTIDKCNEKLNEAKDWFEKYCIELDLRKLDVDKTIAEIKRKHARQKAIQALKSQKDIIASLDGPRKNPEWRPYHDAVVTIYKRMWRHLKKTGIYVFFVDEYKAIKSYDRIVKASANMGKLPVILISSKDMNAENVATHELIHAFGKTWYKHEGGEEYKDLSGEDYKGMPLTSPWKTHRDLTWEHGDCDNDMGNWLGGGNPYEYFLDWSAYKEFVKCRSINTK